MKYEPGERFRPHNGGVNKTYKIDLSELNRRNYLRTWCCVALLCYSMVWRESKSSTVITLRLKNEELDVLDALSELAGLNRTETLRAFMKPAWDQATVAMETKSMLKASKARIDAEIELTKHIRNIIKATEVQTELGLEMGGQLA